MGHAIVQAYNVHNLYNIQDERFEVEHDVRDDGLHPGGLGRGPGGHRGPDPAAGIERSLLFPYAHCTVHTLLSKWVKQGFSSARYFCRCVN